jgi:hypothetical protein
MSTVMRAVTSTVIRAVIMARTSQSLISSLTVLDPLISSQLSQNFTVPNPLRASLPQTQIPSEPQSQIPSVARSLEPHSPKSLHFLALRVPTPLISSPSQSPTVPNLLIFSLSEPHSPKSLCFSISQSLTVPNPLISSPSQSPNPPHFFALSDPQSPKSPHFLAL